MKISSLKYWHWIVISILVGVALGYVYRQDEEDLQSRFGTSVDSQARFESMLVTKVQDRPRFDKVAVHKQFVVDAKGVRKSMYVVAGVAPGGGKWLPVFFATDIPYKPAVSLSRLNAEGGPDYAKMYADIPNPTVIDYLNVLGKARGITYKHVWWRELGMVFWVAASVIVIGVIWPTIINLLARRPKEVNVADPGGVSPTTSNPVTPIQTRTEAERE